MRGGRNGSWRGKEKSVRMEDVDLGMPIWFPVGREVDSGRCTVTGKEKIRNCRWNPEVGGREMGSGNSARARERGAWIVGR